MTLQGTLGVTVGETVTFSFAVVNPSGEPVTITFPDGRQVDITVFAHGGGDRLWRWSESRMFTQAIETLAIEAGASRTWTREWIDPPAGRFRAVAELAADSAVTAEAIFEVRRA